MEGKVGTGDQVIAFGPYRLLPAHRLLLQGEQPVAVGSRAIDLLLTLIERPGEIISKETLISRAWPKIFVEEANLRVQVSALRRALGDGQGGRRYILASPGRGYSFVGRVTVSQSAAHPEQDGSNLGRVDTLPANPGRLIGRAGPIHTIATQVRNRVLVTVTGPGGIGKTITAVAAARQAASHFQDGVVFLDLSSFADPGLVSSGLAAALGLTARSEDPLPTIAAFLERRQMLLLIDNCEQVIEGAAALVECVLEAAPHVHVLATSREPLRAVGERVYRLPGLESPPPGLELTAAGALTYPGVQLFVEQAAATLGSFKLTDGDAPVVAEICRRLDGMALAIELAARRVDALNVRQLLSQLDDRFRLLTTGRRTAVRRHQTLGATLEWSYNLLPDKERKILRRLAIFAGSFTLDSATAISIERDGIGIAAHVAELVAKSLLNFEDGGNSPSYRMLETMKLFGLEKLKAANEREDVARQHATYVLQILKRDTQEGADLENVDFMLGELRSALAWCFADNGDSTLATALAVAAVPLWVKRSLLTECRDTVERALDILDREPEPDPHACMILNAALGWSLMYAAGSTEQVGDAWQKALGYAKMLGSTDYRLRSLWGLWINRLNQGAFRDALRLAEDFAELSKETSDTFDLAMADRVIGTSLHFLGDQKSARRYIESAIRQMPGGAWPASRFQADQRVTSRYFLARILWLQGFPESAMRLAVYNVENAAASENALSFGSVLGQGACPIALWTGDLEAAERFGDQLLHHTRRYGLKVWNGWARCYLAVIRFKRGDPGGLEASCSELAAAGPARGLPRYLPLLGTVASGLGHFGQVGEALEMISEAITRSETNEELWFLPELLRVAGELSQLRGGQDVASAPQTIFNRGLDLAARQGALSLELRLATSMGHVLIEKGQLTEARKLIGKTYARFSEGLETEDLQTAKILLADRI